MGEESIPFVIKTSCSPLGLELAPVCAGCRAVVRPVPLRLSSCIFSKLNKNYYQFAASQGPQQSIDNQSGLRYLFRVLGSEVLGSGFWVQRFRVLGSEVLGSGFWVQRFWVQGSEVLGSGFRGSGFRVLGSGLKVQPRRLPQSGQSNRKRNSERVNPPEACKYRISNPPPADCKQGITNIEVQIS
jgi:hypothetical protein